MKSANPRFMFGAERACAGRITAALACFFVGCTTPPTSPKPPAIAVTHAPEAPPTPKSGVVSLALPTRCSLSPDGLSVALTRGGNLELWSVDKGLERWRSPLAQLEPKLRFSTDGSVLFAEGRAFEANSGRSMNEKLLATAPKRWSALEGGVGIRVSALAPEAIQRLTPFATGYGFVVAASGEDTILTLRDPRSDSEIQPSDDARVIVVTGHDPKSPIRQGFAAGIDLETGKTWRVEAWTTGGGSSTSELRGRSSIRAAKLRVSWGRRSDRVVLVSEHQAGFEVRQSGRLYDAQSGASLRDLPTGSPEWSTTGALLAAGDIVHAGGGAPSHGAWSDVFQAAWSANDERFVTLTSSGCSVFDVKAGVLVLSAPSFVALPAGRQGICVGRTVVTEERGRLSRWDPEKGTVMSIGELAPNLLTRFQIDTSGKFALVAAEDAVVRLDLERFEMSRVELTAPPASKTPPAAAIAPGGTRFAVAVERHVELRSFDDATVVRTKQPLQGSIEALAWAFDGARVIVVTQEPRGPRVYVIDAASGAVSEQLRGKLGPNRVDRVDNPRIVATHPTEARAAIAIAAPNMTSGKSAVIVWDYQTNKVVFTFAGRVHTPSEVVFTPAGDLYLATPSESLLWNEKTALRPVEGAKPLRLTLDDVARFGVEPLVSRWKDSAVSDRTRLTMYCGAEGERVQLEADGLRVEKPDGSRLFLVRARSGSSEGLVMLDPRGRYDGVAGLEGALRPPTLGATNEITLSARTPTLAQEFFGAAASP